MDNISPPPLLSLADPKQHNKVEDHSAIELESQPLLDYNHWTGVILCVTAITKMTYLLTEWKEWYHDLIDNRSGKSSGQITAH